MIHRTIDSDAIHCNKCQKKVGHYELMTLKLSKLYQTTLTIRKIKQQYSDNTISRSIILHDAHVDYIYADIEIVANNIPAEMCRLLVESTAPFGAVAKRYFGEINLLETHFFQADKNKFPYKFSCQHLYLHGRHTKITGNGKIIAEVYDYSI
ncbi:MAG: hypothetical protein GY821_09250 [Gammaproteobacteria bacterium]|nr:hypothetical protein [Gammaproteobacteria bacterium]